MSNFSFTKLGLEGAYLIDYFSVGDNRGGFSKLYEKAIYNQYSSYYVCVLRCPNTNNN